MYKNVLYDWFGYNKILFTSLNNITENTAILTTLQFITDYIGNYMMFPAHLCLVVLLIYTLTYTKKQTLEIDLLYIKSIITLLAALMLFLTVGELMKRYFSFVRPYCSPEIALNSTVQSIMSGHYNMHKCLRSLPSGHTQYISTFVLSMWPLLNKQLKILGASSIITVMFSRVILGAHFPADTLYGFVLAVSLVSISRLIIKNTVMKPTLKKLKDNLHI